MTLSRVLVGSLMFVLAACAGGTTDRPIMRVDVADEGRTLWLSVASCNGNPSAEVDESTTQVAVHVRGGTTNNDCGDIVCVRLEEPLGERTVLDDTTGDPIPVLEAGDDFGKCP